MVKWKENNKKPRTTTKNTLTPKKVNKSVRIGKLLSITTEMPPVRPPLTPILSSPTPFKFHVNAANIISLHILGDVETLIPLFIVCNKKACCKPYFKCAPKSASARPSERERVKAKNEEWEKMAYIRTGQPAKYTVYVRSVHFVSLISLPLYW